MGQPLTLTSWCLQWVLELWGVGEVVGVGALTVRHSDASASEFKAT
jgi:hypothetical protein